ncbi:phage major capsid protein, P2 family [Asticcacaulis taihuensis]|uniref:phage major capsid protein, P2 family n=1 Tax=Asticcacaulis taihuensis TaxID=260084 RepID=UPI0026EFC4C5|nr:phage major capsid protein, P2 family [Asticcacaulis taihuensis]
MRPETIELYEEYAANVALKNGVRDPSQKFTVDPTIQQKLVDKQKESSSFLQSINIEIVPEQKASILGLGTSARKASRTNTRAGGKRTTQSVFGLTERTYECQQTNYDTHVTYQDLDRWAKFDDFEVRIQNQIVEDQALDRICIGFNGTSVAATTDIENNPLLQDVNIGWLQKLRTEAPTHLMTHGGTAGKITYGPEAGADYKSLDAMVYDARHTYLPSWARTRNDLVAIVGYDLAHDKYFPKINKDLDPTEELALQIIMSDITLGGMRGALVPFFPAGTVFITPLKNLSIYEQEGSRRRHLKDNPEIDAKQDFQSANDAYVIEDLDLACLLENVQVFEEDEGA